MKALIVVCGLTIASLQIGCAKREAASSPDTASNATESASSTTSSAAETLSASSTSKLSRVLSPFPAGAKLVRVEFDGGMSHVLRSSKPSRTAFLVNSMRPHSVEVLLPRNPDVTEAVQATEIRNVTGIAPTLLAGKGFHLNDVKGLVFRILDPSTTGPMNPPLDTTLEFDFLVPHLSKVANVVETDLDADLDKDPGAKFVDFFDLDGGLLSASPFCLRAKFNPDNETPARGLRGFANIVTLTGTTGVSAILQVRKAGSTTWSDLHFGNVDVVRILFRNQPVVSEAKPHFDMHHSIAGGISTWPVIEKIETLCAVSDSVPGCANSTWP